MIRKYVFQMISAMTAAARTAATRDLATVLSRDVQLDDVSLAGSTDSDGSGGIAPQLGRYKRMPFRVIYRFPVARLRILS